MDDRVFGALILVGSLVGIVAYFYLVFMSPWAVLVIRLSAFLVMALVLAVTAWLGYTRATTPPLAPLEDFGLDEMAEGEEESSF